MQPLVCSISATCRMLGLGRTKVYDLLATGALQSIHIGRRRLVLVASIHALLDSGMRDDA